VKDLLLKGSALVMEILHSASLHSE
jgi:hypothetical protein